MLPLFCALINPIGQVLRWFGHMPHNLSRTSGLNGGIDWDLGLMATSLGEQITADCDFGQLECDCAGCGGRTLAPILINPIWRQVSDQSARSSGRSESEVACTHRAIHQTSPPANITCRNIARYWASWRGDRHPTWGMGVKHFGILGHYQDDKVIQVELELQ